MAQELDHNSVSNFKPITFELSNEIVTHKGATRTLTLNMFTAGSFVRYGSPIVEETDLISKTVRRSFNYKAVIGFVRDATGIDQELLQSIPGNDMEPLAYAILGMMSFQHQRKKSSESASVPSDGS